MTHKVMYMTTNPSKQLWSNIFKAMEEAAMWNEGTDYITFNAVFKLSYSTSSESVVKSASLFIFIFIYLLNDVVQIACPQLF